MEREPTEEEERAARRLIKEDMAAAAEVSSDRLLAAREDYAQARAKLENAAAEYDGLRAANEKLKAEQEKLRAEIARLRDEREARARALGYASLDAYLRARYQDEGKPVGLLAAELGVAETTVTADMDRVGIPRRPQSERLAAGRAALHAGRKRRREALLARARELGFDSLAAYLTERHHERGWRRADIAAELGLSPTPFKLTRLMDAEGVAGNPRAGPRADAPRE